ncbi:hypothetical protein ACHAXM_008442 [Skeletonema potamos]|jgi:fluoride ion exporter CrcB/FEX
MMIAIPVLDGHAKYTKKSHIYRTPAQRIWVVLLPAAATCTTDVWFQTAILSSAIGYDFVLAIANVSGAFLDGFFAEWESGGAVPNGSITEAFHLISEDMRASFLSTYTSWAGMVGVAASVAHSRSSFLIGLGYIIVSILCAFVAVQLGSDFAKYLASSAPITHTSYQFAKKAHTLLHQFMMLLILYIMVSYIFLNKGGTQDLIEGKQLLIASTPWNQLSLSIIFAVLGAYAGNKVADDITPKFIESSVLPMGTLICNAFFGLLGLSLNCMRLSDESWEDSLVLRAFALNFCGAASLFARHASDNRNLYGKNKDGLRLAGINITANILFATLLYWVALEMEILLNPEATNKKSGRVVRKLLKILERQREGQNALTAG